MPAGLITSEFVSQGSQQRLQWPRDHLIPDFLPVSSSSYPVRPNFLWKLPLKEHRGRVVAVIVLNWEQCLPRSGDIWQFLEAFLVVNHGEAVDSAKHTIVTQTAPSQRITQAKILIMQRLTGRPNAMQWP